MAFAYLMGGGGAAVAATASVLGSAPLLLGGLIGLGGGLAAGLAARFAAADRAEPAHRARNMSFVIAATTVGSIAGPALSGPADLLGRDLGLPAFTGPYSLAAIAFGAAALTALRLRSTTPAHVPEPARHGPVRLRAPILCLSLSGAAMISMMTMTPVHLTHSGTELTAIGLIVATHMAAMYAPAPLFGRMAETVGRTPTLITGCLQILAAALLAGTVEAVPATALSLLLVGAAGPASWSQPPP